MQAMYYEKKGGIEIVSYPPESGDWIYHIFKGETKMQSIRISSFNLLERCKGSLGVSDSEDDDGGLIIKEDALYARQGSCTHEINEQIVLKGAVPDFTPFLKKWNVKFEEVSQPVFTFYDMWTRSVGIYDGKDLPPLTNYFMDTQTEVEFEFDLDGFHITGHADLTGDSADGHHVLDHKAGFLDTNYDAQLRGYMYGYFEKLHSWNQLHSDKFYGWIARLRNDKEHRFETMEMTVVELTEWMSDFIRSLNDWDGKTYHPGDHCGFCPRRYSCPALDIQLSTSYSYVTGIDRDKALADFKAAPCKFVDKLKQAKDIIANLDRMVKFQVSMYGSLEDPDGRILTTKTPSERIISEAAIKELINLGFTPEQILKVANISKKGVSEIAMGSVNRGEKGAFKRDVLDELREKGCFRSDEVGALTSIRR